MKTKLMAVVAGLVLAVGAGAATIWTVTNIYSTPAGYAVPDTVVELDFSPGAACVSIINNGAGTVYIGKNCSAAAFAANISAGTAGRVPPGKSVTVLSDKANIATFLMQSGAGTTNGVDLVAY